MTVVGQIDLPEDIFSNRRVRQLLDMTGSSTENPTLDVPSRYVFSRGQKAIRVWGPIEVVVDEIAELHRSFWS